MSDNLVFSPIQIGSMNLKNRIMRSATHEGTTTDDGFPTKRLLNVIKNLALGDVGLIVPGYFSISKEGIAAKRQSHLFTQEHANSWKDTVSFVHSKGSKIVFQLAHAGIAASKSVGPSQFFKMNDALTIPEIEVIIDDFVKSAKLAYSINVDGVQLHAAHGYLLSEFLSPITNRRKDKYGGSFENNIRIIQEIADEVKKATDESFSIMIKMNGSDRWGSFGVTPEIAAKYVSLFNRNIDLFEISAGFAIPHSIGRTQNQKNVPNSLSDSLFRRIYKYKDGFNLDCAEVIKKMNPDKIIATVGGNRYLKDFETILSEKKADIISISRPFIRQPHLVKDMMSGKINKVDCVNCGLCLTQGLKHPNGIHCYFPDLRKK